MLIQVNKLKFKFHIKTYLLKRTLTLPDSWACGIILPQNQTLLKANANVPKLSIL
jgi:hypothetical protein